MSASPDGAGWRRTRRRQGPVFHQPVPLRGRWWGATVVRGAPDRVRPQPMRTLATRLPSSTLPQDDESAAPERRRRPGGVGHAARKEDDRVGPARRDDPVETPERDEGERQSTTTGRQPTGQTPRRPPLPRRSGARRPEARRDRAATLRHGPWARLAAATAARLHGPGSGRTMPGRAPGRHLPERYPARPRHSRSLRPSVVAGGLTGRAGGPPAPSGRVPRRATQHRETPP